MQYFYGRPVLPGEKYTSILEYTSILPICKFERFEARVSVASALTIGLTDAALEIIRPVRASQIRMVRSAFRSPMKPNAGIESGAEGHY